jgi:putative methyltransferase
MNILISCPPISDHFAYYPYIDLIVRDELSEYDTNFHRCIYHRFTPDTVGQFDDTLRQTDILLLSCYIWNWELQLLLSNRARAINPSIVLVAGGPQLHRSHYRWFDYNVVGEVEGSIQKILDGTAENIIHSARKTDFSQSPYVNQLPAILDIKEHSPNPLGIIFETSRGCPYACSYCDWGSLTLSKVHFYDIERVKSELEVICKEVKPNYLFLADANFGIAKRDTEIAKFITSMKQTYGAPKSFYYSVSKNNPTRNFEIGKTLFDGGVVDNYIVSVVHTDRDVLKINDRGNISTKKFHELSQKCVDNGLPTQTQLILGMPGDTKEKWFDNICETFEWGLHAETKPYWYNVLPNAPANNEKFWNEWDIKTQRVIFSQARLKADDELIDKTAEIIVQCKSFSKDDWVTMNKHARWLQALHNFALLRNVAMYYRHVLNISYSRFYTGILDYLWSTDLGHQYNSQYESYLGRILDIRFQDQYVPFEFNGKEVNIEPEDVLFMHLLDNKEHFYWLVTGSVGWDSIVVQDLINYQKDSMIDMTYSPVDGRKIAMEYDWIKWFDELGHQAYYKDGMDPPPKLNKEMVYETNQIKIEGPTEFTTSRILWHKTTNKNRKLQLYAKAILGQIDFRGERTQFKRWSKVS